jgi:leucyl/phenylalanyl-tRNA--protein transferase
MAPPTLSLPWLEPGDPFPDVTHAWGAGSDAPGLLCVGADLQPHTLQQAYAQGIFPWFSEGQPTLWWSPDPRMVLQMQDFRLHRSLRKTLTGLLQAGRLEVRMDHAFDAVIRACAQTARRGQPGTWILPEMVQAYQRLHAQGLAHSVEAWIDGELAGGLYCIGLGRAVFGESMFTRVPDASKIALTALVVFCRQHGIRMVDCQQNTPHLAFMGAQEIARGAFLQHVRHAHAEPAPAWRFDPVYWDELLSA